MNQNKGSRTPSTTSSVVADNLKALRERREFLKRDIPRLLFAGCRKVPGAVSVQDRALTPGERQLIGDYQREIKDIERTIRAFGS